MEKSQHELTKEKNMNAITTQAAAICGLILSIASVVTLVITIIRKAKAPETKQNERLDTLEKAVKEHDKMLRDDFDHFARIESGNKIMQKCMLALLRHGIDGNDIKSMEDARDKLNDYLINH